MTSVRGIVIEIIGDATSLIRTSEQSVKALFTVGSASTKLSESLIGSNAKIAESNTLAAKSYEQIGVAAQLAADAQIKTALKARSVREAQIAALGTRAAQAPTGSREAQAALALQAKAQAQLNRELGISSAATATFGNKSKTAERDLNKLSRGVLSGSGILSKFGQSLAFASSGFIAASLGAAGIVTSIKDAEDLAKAQESLTVAIKHTGGSVDLLQPKYEAIAKAAAKLGITETEATTGLARATVLTGNAAAAQRAYQEALVISKATGKDFNSVLIATSKGQAGITTSLRRYGVLVDTTSTGQEQFNQVMRRFGGQAAANTTAMDKLHAAFTNALTTIGTALLPTFEKLATSLADWLTKMNESGKLEKDVATGLSAIHAIADPVIGDLQTLAGAVDDLSKAWGGLKGLLPGLPGGGNLGSSIAAGIKDQFKLTVNPFGTLINSFKSPPAPPPPKLISPSTFFPSFGRPPSSLFGNAQPLKQFWQKFQLTFAEQLAQVQASLTKGSADDVAAAKQVIARIRKLLGAGRLHGQALLQALALEATAVGTIQSAEAAAVQKRAQAAQAAKAKIEAQIQAQIDPINLEIQLARAQISGAPVVAILRKMREAALKIANSTKVSLKDQLAALQQVLSIQQQIKDATQGQTAQFQVPAKLALRLARDQALGQDTTKDLLAIKKAILKFISTHRKNIKALTDAYNQLAAINQQLGSTAQSALGLFKQASTKALTQGLGLTAAQRKALRARLSQLGPGGTVAGDGTGAFGFVIGDNGRPIQVQVNLDGKKVADSTTKHQRRHKRRNPSQRRGPHAGN